MKLYYEKNNNKTAFSPVGRYKRIYFNGNGDPYFRWNNRRKYLNEIPRLHPVLPEDERGKCFELSGLICLSNTACLLVEIHPDGEMVRLWEEVQIDE